MILPCLYRISQSGCLFTCDILLYLACILNFNMSLTNIIEIYDYCFFIQLCPVTIKTDVLKLVGEWSLSILGKRQAISWMFH